MFMTKKKNLKEVGCSLLDARVGLGDPSGLSGVLKVTLFPGVRAHSDAKETIMYNNIHADMIHYKIS